MISVSMDQIKLLQQKIDHIEHNLKATKGDREQAVLRGILIGLKTAAYLFRCEILLKFK